MASLLGLAGYGSDHSDDGDNEETSQKSPTSLQEEGDESPALRRHGDASEGRDGTAELQEDPDSRLLEDSNSMGVEEVGNTRTASFDAPAPPPSKESRQFFMPLPSPVVRLSTASPFIPFDPPNDGVGGEGEGADAGGVEVEEEDKGDGDIIKPEYRDMLPPEATGQANPKLQSKIAKYLDKMAGDFTKSIKGKKDYGNPAVLAQICHFCNVDDKGTNYPADRVIHPSVYDTKDFHDSLMAEFRRADRPKKDKQPVLQDTEALQQQMAAAHAQAHSRAQAQAQAQAQAAAIAAAGAPAHMRVTTVTTTVRTTTDAIVPGTNAVPLVPPIAGTTRKRGNKWGSVVPTLPSGLPTIVRAGQVGAAEAVAAAAGQTMFNSHAQAAQVAKDAQQQRAEAIAKLQMITNRLEKAAQDQGVKEQPPKKQRLS